MSSFLKLFPKTKVIYLLYRVDNNWSIGGLEWFEETVKVAYKLAAPGGSKKILFENVNFKTPKSSVVHFDASYQREVNTRERQRDLMLVDGKLSVWASFQLVRNVRKTTTRH